MNIEKKLKRERGMKIKNLKHVLIVLLLAFALTGNAALIKEIERAGLTATREKYPDTYTVLLYNQEKIRYDEKGLSDSTDEYYQKVLTEKGKKLLRSFTFHFNSTYETLTIEKAEIIRAGKTIKINPAENSKISSESAFGGMSGAEANRPKVSVPSSVVGTVQ